MWYDYYILVCFRKVATLLFDRKKTVFEILLKEMAMKSLDRQLKLMALVIVCAQICVRRNVSIYYKATGIDMQSPAVAGVTVMVVHTVIVIQKVEMKLTHHT